MAKAAVIGGGLGGLAMAAILAHDGFEVTLFERQPALGGKLRRIEKDGCVFDRGPSTITLPDLFHPFFERVGKRLEDYMEWYRLDPAVRNIFTDGSMVDLGSDTEAVESQIARYSKADASKYRAFLKTAKVMYNQSRAHFLNRLFVDKKTQIDPSLLAAFARIRPFTKLDSLLRSYFRHPNTLDMFGRYATYTGSSPYEAPAVFAMLAHAETETGIYGIRGGTSQLAATYERIAREMGVRIRTSEGVEKLLVKDGKVAGVRTVSGEYAADYVVANGDLLSIYNQIIPPEHRPSMPDQRLDRFEPSHSGFVILAKADRIFKSLRHHTVFFPGNYREEFVDLFKRKRLPQDPAIYICFSGFSDKSLAPEGASNLFILVNAPCLAESGEWHQAGQYAQHVIRLLEQRGLDAAESDIRILDTYSPLDLYRDTSAWRGAIYGISSNRFRQAFFRPPNRCRDIQGLWFVGGSTHPGGGTPMVTLGARLVADALLQEWRGHNHV